MATKSESALFTEQLKQRNWELSVLSTIAEALNKEVDLALALKITPGDCVRAVDCLLTGMHEPGATHLRMLSVLAGVEHVTLSYHET